MKLLKCLVWVLLDIIPTIKYHWTTIREHNAWPWERDKLNKYENESVQQLIKAIQFDIENDIDHEAPKESKVGPGTLN